MNYALIIDICCCGSDCYGQLNNPILSEFRIISDQFETKKIISHTIIPNEPITAYTELMTGESLESIRSNESSVELNSYLESAYSVLSKCMSGGMYLIGYNHINYDLKILNDHFTKILKKPEIVWPPEKVIDVAELCKHVLPYKEVGTFTMDACWYYINHEKNVTLHIPSCDNTILIDLMQYCMNGKSFDETYNMMNVDYEFNEFMWGKYKGMSFDYVYNNDRNYIYWLLKNAKNNIPLIKRIKEQMDSEVDDVE